MNERDRLAVLVSLSWLLLLPVGWFLTYSPLARLKLFRALLGLAYILHRCCFLQIASLVGIFPQTRQNDYRIYGTLRLRSYLRDRSNLV